MTVTKRHIILFFQFQNILECFAGKHFVVLVFQQQNFARFNQKLKKKLILFVKKSSLSIINANFWQVIFSLA